MEAVTADAAGYGVKLTAKRKNLLRTALTSRDETAAPVIRKTHNPGRVEPDPVRGLVETTANGRRRIVQYEPGTELRDSEQVSLLDEDGVEGFLRREVLPYAPDAWYDPASVKTGYEISFTHYFYKPQPMRSPAEIRADISAVERETEGLLAEIIGDDGRA